MKDTIRSIVRKYRDAADEQRAALLADRLATQPRCGVTRYLAGCAEFDRRRFGVAVRHMMVARHAEPQFDSAALLVFAGLSWIDRPADPPLTVLHDTWIEFRRPAFNESRRERLLLSLLAEPEAIAPASLPADLRRFVVLPIGFLRHEFARVAAETTGDPSAPIGMSASG